MSYAEPRSRLPGVSLLFASQSRPNVSPGNGYEFYSGLIFLVPIVAFEEHRALFAINHLRRCCYSPPRGCILNFCARRSEEEVDESSTTPLLREFSLLHLFILFPSSPDFLPRRKQEFCKRPRGP